MGVDPVTMGIKVGLMALQMGLQAMNKMEGPRLDSLDVTTADYGTPFDYFEGLRRLEGCPIIWAEKLREKKVTSKTKGGKYSEYKYYGTFAVAIADHEIDKVTRIWLDKHLCFDLTKPTPVSALIGRFTGVGGSPVKLVQGRNVRFYTGTETQMPDPRMEAWCEDRYGPDSCPAYRGIAYLVFEDIPLEKFGNRIPQVTVEAVRNPTEGYLWDAVDYADASGIVFSPDYTRFVSGGGLFDTATREKIADVNAPIMAVGSFGDVYRLADQLGTGGGPYLRRWWNDGQMYGFTIVPSPSDDVIIIYDGTNDIVILPPYANAGTSVQIYDYSTGIGSYYLGWAFSTGRVDNNGNVWFCGFVTGNTNAYLHCYKGPRAGESHTVTTSSTQAPALYFNANNEFVIRQGSNLYRLAEDFTLLQSATITSTGTFTAYGDSLFRVAISGGAVTEYSLLDLSTVRIVNSSSYSGAPTNMDNGKYDPINHAVVKTSGGQVVWFFLDRIGGSGATLGSLVTRVSEMCGLDTIDVSDLDQTLTGYSWTQGTGKDIISPLLDIHDVDACPHDFSITFRKRGNASAGTISEFVREGDEPRYTITIAQDTDIPRRITLNFADANKDQQSNTVIAQRPLDAADTVRVQQLDLTTYVATPGEAQKFADRYFRRKWNERETITLSLTSQYLSLEPGDVHTLQLDGVAQQAKLQKVTLSQGRLTAEWKRDAITLNALGTGAGAEMEGRDEEVIYIPSPTKGFVKDIPLAEDAHDSSLPQLYYGAGRYVGNWPGAVLYEGTEDGADYSPWQGVDSSEAATWGYATDALATANWRLWDRGNTVNVAAKETLTNCTESDIEADPSLNLALLGDELLNFTTATLEADGTYTLSGFLRGRRGTEWAVDSHVSGEEFVLMETLSRSGLGLSEVGTTLYYRAQTLARDFDSAPTISFDLAGATLKPYAPARIIWTTDGTDLFGEIVRRTRLGGSWDDDGVVPLSENSEAYEVDVMDGTDVVRTITVTGTNTFTYAAADLATDGFDLDNVPNVNVYQMSDAVGRGFALAA